MKACFFPCFAATFLGPRAYWDSLSSHRRRVVADQSDTTRSLGQSNVPRYHPGKLRWMEPNNGGGWFRWFLLKVWWSAKWIKIKYIKIIFSVKNCQNVSNINIRNHPKKNMGSFQFSLNCPPPPPPIRDNGKMAGQCRPFPRQIVWDFVFKTWGTRLC